MTDDRPIRVRRRRQANVEGGRRGRFEVLVDDAERERLVTAASEQGVTVPRLLVESALAPAGETATERRDAMTRVFAMQRTLTGAAVNINQIARQANSEGDVPAGAQAAVAELRASVSRLDQLLEQLAAAS